MYKIFFKPSFVKQARKLNGEQYELLKKRIELLKNRNNHSVLRVHKLHGGLARFHSFSLDYSVRVIFKFDSENTISIIDIGNHDIYK